MKHFFFALVAFVMSMLFVLPAVASNALVGNWNLISYDGTGAQGSVEFTETMVYSKFCNNVSQGYVYNSGTIVASGAGMSTMMYCEGLSMTLETNFTFTPSAMVVLSGTELTITTDAKHVFVFEQEVPTICTLQYEPVCGDDGMTYGNACAAVAAKVAVVSEGVCPSDPSCVQKFDGCNTCTRMEGEDTWACTKMYCETPATPYCTATSDDTMVGNDADEHGCLGSAGYSWSQSTQACIRVWENTGATSLEVAYDFAFNNGMTTMETMVAFRAEDFITRQEAAKMLVSFLENSKGNLYSGGEANPCVNKYTDAASFDPTLKGFIAAACGYGMMQGAAHGTLFMPNESMTKGQALAILMRSLDGWQAEPDTNERWMPYVVKAKEANIITFEHTSDFNTAISRGDLIKMVHTIYLNTSVSK